MTMIENPAPEVPTRRSYNKKVIAALVAALIGVTVIIGLLVNRGDHSLINSVSASSDNYLTNTSSLETSIEDSFNADSDTEYDGATVTDVTCIAQEHRMFLCHLDWSDDDETTADVQVNAAGDNWVSTNHN